MSIDRLTKPASFRHFVFARLWTILAKKSWHNPLLLRETDLFFFLFLPRNIVNHSLRCVVVYSLKLFDGFWKIREVNIGDCCGNLCFRFEGLVLSSVFVLLSRARTPLSFFRLRFLTFTYFIKQLRKSRKLYVNILILFTNAWIV